MKQLIYIFSIFTLVACGAEQKKESKTPSTEVVIKGEAQGTTYTIKYLAEEYEKGLKERFDSLLNAIDQSMSTYVPNSTISALNNGDTVQIDDMFKKVFELSYNINQQTEGAFDPTIGPLIKAWGFDYSNPQKMDTAIVQDLLANSGFEQFELKGNVLNRKSPKARINFNAVAQGYSVDLMANMLDNMQLNNYYVELGGELKTKGKNKFGDLWVIGIDRPVGKNLERNLVQRMSLDDAAMATSGNYRKFYEVDGQRYSHTLNPINGFPALNSLLSATVIAEDCGTADAYATAFMVMGKDASIEYLKQHSELKAYLISSTESGDFQTYVSLNLENYLLKD